MNPYLFYRLPSFPRSFTPLAQIIVGSELRRVIGGDPRWPDPPRRVVGRMRSASGSTASCFLVADDWVLTNNHVLRNKRKAAKSVIWFDYEFQYGTVEPTFVVVACDPDAGFLTNKDLDYSLVKVRWPPGPNDGQPPPGQQFGFCRLSEADAPSINDRLAVFQHPAGAPKHCSEGTVTDVDASFVYYTASTMSSSSGSPCFDRESWTLRSLHSGIGTMNGDFVLTNKGVRADVIRADASGMGINLP